MCLRESERNRAAASASTKGSNRESNSAGQLSDVGRCADILDVSPVAEIWPLQANKKHSFHNWRGKECREALSISGAYGRGSEHGAVLGYAPRRAAQAGLTEGADRSARLRLETNVRNDDQPKAVPLSLVT